MKLLSVLDGRAHASEGLCDGPVEVVVVGAGGSGSHLVPMLAVLSQSLLDWGHPGGLAVTLVDDDVVTAANVGRSRYFAPDVGAGKAATLITRVNLCYGTAWQAVTARVGNGEPLECLRRARIVVGCVDTRRARRAIHEAAREAAGRWHAKVWLDLGNGAFDGQVILGEVGKVVGRDRLPHVLDLYPEMADPTLDPADSGPSCSRAEALARQGPFTNLAGAARAASMLTALWRGGLGYSALWFDESQGRSGSMRLSRAAWADFGYDPQRERVEAELSLREGCETA